MLTFRVDDKLCARCGLCALDCPHTSFARTVQRDDPARIRRISVPEGQILSKGPA